MLKMRLSKPKLLRRIDASVFPVDGAGHPVEAVFFKNGVPFATEPMRKQDGRYVATSPPVEAGPDDEFHADFRWSE